MQLIMSYIKEYWILCALFVLAVIALIFVSIKASQAVARTKAEKEKLIKKLDHMKKIREGYAELTEEKILSDTSEDLLEGVTDNIQQHLEKSEDMAEAFSKLNEEEKIAYAFFYFLDEAKVNVSEFFKAYSKPLTPYALKACEAFCDENLYSLIKSEYDSYDEDNEESSVIESEIAKLDEKIKEIFNEKELKLASCEYIKKNAEKFV